MTETWALLSRRETHDNTEVWFSPSDAMTAMCLWAPCDIMKIKVKTSARRTHVHWEEWSSG